MLVCLNKISFHILGMNFLSRYEVKINYKKKKDRFWLDNGEFTFREAHMLRMMINSVKAKKMLSKGFTRYLTHVVNRVDESIPSL